MKTFTGYILMVMVTVLVSWGVAPNEIQAIGGPCDQLASLDNELERLEEQREDARKRVEEASELPNTVAAAFGERARELKVPYADPRWMRSFAWLEEGAGSEAHRLIAYRYDGSRQLITPPLQFQGEWRDPHWRPGASSGTGSGSASVTCGRCEMRVGNSCVSCRSHGLRCKGGRCVQDHPNRPRRRR